MNKFIKPVIYYLPLTILLSSYSLLPNRISLIIIVLYLIYKYNIKLLKYILNNKYKFLLIVTSIAVISIFNNVLFREILLYMSIPIYLLIYKFIKNYTSDNLKKHFSYSIVIFISIVIFTKFISIYYSGINDFISNGYWWNKIIYLNLVNTVNGHPTYIAISILISFIFLLNQIIENRWFISKIKTLIIVLLQFSFLLLLSVKIAYITLALLIILFITWLIKTKNILLSLTITITAILITFFTVNNIPSISYRLKIDYQNINKNKDILNTQSKFSERLALWKSSIEAIKENPILGSSFRNIKSKEALYKKVTKLNNFSDSAKNSHNNYLEFGVRYGFSGLISLVVLSIYILSFGLKNNSFEVISVGVVFILFSLTESFLVREQGIMILATTIGFIRKEYIDERGF